MLNNIIFHRDDTCKMLSLYALFSLAVGCFAPITAPLATFMYAIGTGDLECLKYVWHRNPIDDTLSVVTWMLHLVAGFACLLIDYPYIILGVQMFLGTIIQHELWMWFNQHKREKKGHLFVPFWSLPLFEAWKDVCVTFIPMLVTVLVFGF